MATFAGGNLKSLNQGNPLKVFTLNGLRLPSDQCDCKSPTTFR